MTYWSNLNFWKTFDSNSLPSVLPLTVYVCACLKAPEGHVSYIFYEYYQRKTDIE